MNARAVVFDIGKVVLHWDVHALYEPMLGSRKASEAFLDETGLLDWNVRFDAGLPFGEGIAEMSMLHPHHKEALKAFDDRWIETVPHAIEGTLAIIDQLTKDRVPLYAVTNFAADKWEQAKETYPFLATVFTDAVVSGQEGVIKPGAEIFERLLDRNNLRAVDCVFIDDSAPNVSAAAALGFDAIQFHSPETLAVELRERGFLRTEAAA